MRDGHKDTKCQGPSKLLRSPPAELPGTPLQEEMLLNSGVSATEEGAASTV